MKTRKKMVFGSNTSNYIHRPENKMFENLCSHDFYSQYLICRKSKKRDKTINFSKKHPAHSHYVLSKRIQTVIPTIMYFQLPNSKSFGGHSIIQHCTDLEKTNVQYTSMEEYAKKCCVLFCPFRTLNDIKKSGSHLFFFRNN